MAVIDTGAVEELQEVLLDCAPQQHATGYRISHQQAGFVEATLRQHSNWKVQAPDAWRDRAARQSGDARLECPPLGDLESVLRPYQKQGVAGCTFCARTASAAFWRTKWVWAKRSRPWRFCGMWPAKCGRGPPMVDRLSDQPGV
jgi:hypothetical protein